MNKNSIKILTTIILISLSVFACKAEGKIDFVDIQGIEILMLVDRTDENTFNEYYVFQYEDIDFSLLDDYDSHTFVSANEAQIVINCDGTNLTFMIGGTTSSNNFAGAGLAHMQGQYQLTSVADGNKFNIVLANGGSGGGGTSGDGATTLTCDSGGPGAKSCSSSTSAASISTSCSVECGTGYYACCDDRVNKCKCIKNKPKSTTAPNGSSQVNIAVSGISYYYSN